MATIYSINKGINKSIEFKGLKAQYIWYLGAGIVVLLIVFALLYLIGINQYVCIAIILTLGSALVYKIYGLSNKYGEHGMSKALAARSIPKVVRCNSRKIFIKSKTHQHAKQSTINKN